MHHQTPNGQEKATSSTTTNLASMTSTTLDHFTPTIIANGATEATAELTSVTHDLALAVEPLARASKDTIDPRRNPHLQLMRLDRPHGFTYFVIPPLLGSLTAATHLRIPPRVFASHLASLALFTFLFRGATCAFNDICDADFDRKVARTKKRPLARGALSISAAARLCIALTVAALLVACFGVPGLLRPFPNQGAKWAALLYIVALDVYPLTKRLFYFPQLFLGLVLPFGVVVGAAAAGLEFGGEGFALRYSAGDVPFLDADEARFSVVRLYAAQILWTVAYETIYSYADVQDDVKAGVKNMALLLPSQKRSKALLACLGAGAVALLAAAGRSMGPGCALGGLGLSVRWDVGGCLSWFDVCEVLGVGTALAVQIWSVDLGRPESCIGWFAQGGLVTGVPMVAGFVIEYVSKIA